MGKTNVRGEGAMKKFSNAEKVNLRDVRKRIEQTDLVPSRLPLLDGIERSFQALEKRGIATLAGLRGEWKTAKRRELLAKASGIDMQYLVLLRREVESWFPKPFPLKSFDWFPKSDIAKLEKAGIHDTAALFRAAESRKERSALAKAAGAAPGVVDDLFRCADLTRVQWVSPAAARMLMETGCNSAAELSAADATDLCAGLERVNAGGKFFKGKIGLRDVKRLVRAAEYV
jgi:predicted flap endonuclease-1-like 5' DNA nuclease